MRFRSNLTLAFLVVLTLTAATREGRAQGEGLVMRPDTVDFGGIPVGGNYFGQIVGFENNTGGPVVIDSPYISGQAGNPFAWFSNLIGQFTIGDGFGLAYGVRFHPPWEGPLWEGAFEDDLCIPVEDLPDPCVHLRGVGIEPLVGEVFRGQTATLTTTIPNPGYRPLDLRIRTGQPWATPLPSFAIVPSGETLEVTIALDARDLESGVYRDTLRVEAVGVYFDYVLPYEVTVGHILADEGEAQPAGFVVGEAYPNPTGGATAIPLVLEAPATVTIEGYDVRGRRVLDRRTRSFAAGHHRLAVPSTGWAVGHYYVRVAVDPGVGQMKTVVRKVTIVR